MGQVASNWDEEHIVGKEIIFKYSEQLLYEMKDCDKADTLKFP